MLAEAKMLESFPQFFGIDKEIGEDDDKSSLLDLFGNLGKGVDKAGVPGGLKVLKGVEDSLKLRGAAAGGDFEVKLFVAATETDGVSLIYDEVGKSGCNSAGKIDFGGVVTG